MKKAIEKGNPLITKIGKKYYYGSLDLTIPIKQIIKEAEKQGYEKAKKDFGIHEEDGIEQYFTEYEVGFRQGAEQEREKVLDIVRRICGEQHQEDLWYLIFDDINQKHLGKTKKLTPEEDIQLSIDKCERLGVFKHGLN